MFQKGVKPPQKGEKMTDNPASEPVKAEKPKKVSMTSDEAALFQRISGGDEDWRTIKESDVDDFALANDPMELPPPAKEMKANKKFAFRWAERKPERLDQLRSMPVPLKWWVCNAISTPFLDGWFDPITGGVNKLDCILTFKPYWMYEKERDLDRQAAERQAFGGDFKSKHGVEKAGASLLYDGKEIRAGSEVVASDVDNEIQGEDHGSTFTAEEGAGE